jgi:hypothetical protein
MIPSLFSATIAGLARVESVRAGLLANPVAAVGDALATTVRARSHFEVDLCLPFWVDANEPGSSAPSAGLAQHRRLRS